VIAQDEGSYRYLAESIRKHPDQETLKTMMERAGFGRVQYFNLSGGIVALHKGLNFETRHETSNARDAKIKRSYFSSAACVLAFIFKTFK
jgi:hypothetical protein